MYLQQRALLLLSCIGRLLCVKPGMYVRICRVLHIFASITRVPISMSTVTLPSAHCLSRQTCMSNLHLPRMRVPQSTFHSGAPLVHKAAIATDTPWECWVLSLVLLLDPPAVSRRHWHGIAKRGDFSVLVACWSAQTCRSVHDAVQSAWCKGQTHTSDQCPACEQPMQMTGENINRRYKVKRFCSGDLATHPERLGPICCCMCRVWGSLAGPRVETRDHWMILQRKRVKQVSYGIVQKQSMDPNSTHDKLMRAGKQGQNPNPH